MLAQITNTATNALDALTNAGLTPQQVDALKATVPAQWQNYAVVAGTILGALMALGRVYQALSTGAGPLGAFNGLFRGDSTAHLPTVQVPIVGGGSIAVSANLAPVAPVPVAPVIVANVPAGTVQPPKAP